VQTLLLAFLQTPQQPVDDLTGDAPLSPINERQGLASTLVRRSLRRRFRTLGRPIAVSLVMTPLDETALPGQVGLQPVPILCVEL